MSDLKFSKQHEKKEDRFIQMVFQLRMAVVRHQKSLLIAGLCVVFAGVIVFFGFQSRTKSAHEAKAIFGEGMLLYQESQFSESMARFQKVADQFGGSPSAPLALYLMGSTYYELGNYALSIEAYKKFVDRYTPAEFLCASAYKGLGCAYVQTKDYANAVQAFSEALKRYPDDFSAPEIRYKLARCQVELKSFALAREQLNLILKEHPASEYVRDAERLLTSLPG